MNKKFFTAFLLAVFSVSAISFKAGAEDFSSASTMNEFNSISNYIELKVSLDLPVELQSDLEGKHFLSELLSYIDLNVIGAGKRFEVYPDKVSDFIIISLKEGKKVQEINDLIVSEYKKGTFSKRQDSSDNKSDKKEYLKNQFGGFIAGEFEVKQESDGKNHPIMEINQARIYFSSQINPSDSYNNISFLGEWNPLPEEVTNQVDSLDFDVAGKKETLKLPELKGENGEYIPFERLQIGIRNLWGSGLNLTVGQFRSPFGIWSDYTSHRNFTSTKNNSLVNGFALKKIDLGVMLDDKFNLPFNIDLNLQAALVSKRLGRTFPLPREDDDDEKDFVGHAQFSNEFLVLGTSAYLGSLSLNKRIAYGFDFLIPTKYISLSGEYVYQQNNAVNDTFKTKLDFNTVSSQSAYAQLDYHLLDTFAFTKNSGLVDFTKDFHLYGLFDYWVYSANNKAMTPYQKMFAGLRYQNISNLRWTILEYGRIQEDASKFKGQISSQLELTY